MWKKSLVAGLLTLNVSLASPQDKREYISIATETFMRTNNHINNPVNNELLTHYNVPGFSMGHDYSRISPGGFTFLTGLHCQIVPVSYQISFNREDYGLPSIVGSYNTYKESNYSFGNLYIPIHFGYTVRKMNRD